MQKFSVGVIPVFLGPLLCLILNLIDLPMINPVADRVISVAVWMVVWWVFEVVSISVTALIPVVVFPILQIMSFKDVTANYASPIVFLFLGGFLLALAMEKVHLHKRIALNILKLTGNTTQGILVGFISATALLSMWVSNTATTLVLMPIAITVVDFISGQVREADQKSIINFKVAILMAVAYAANIGGTATIIGTPPNVVLVGFMENSLNREVDFFYWSMISMPFAVLMLLVTYVVVKKTLPHKIDTSGVSLDIVDQQLKEMGPIMRNEVKVALCFSATILLWMFRTSFNDLIGLSLTNGEIAMFGGFSTFIVPVSSHKDKISWLLEWKDTKELQWGILIMFGGGLALAMALSDSGIIQFIGDYMMKNDFSNFAMMTFLILVMTVMTTLMSNVALVAVFAPLVSGIAQGAGVDFLHIGMPLALASSCAFMLPMSTPPNAIVYTSGVIQVKQMLRVGFLLNLVSSALLIAMGLLMIRYL